MKEWTKGPSGNLWLRITPNCYVSYNRKSAMPAELVNVTNLLESLMNIATKDEETVLVLENDKGKTMYLPLEGDFRKEYEEVFDLGLDGCLAVYQENCKEFGILQKYGTEVEIKTKFKMENLH